MHDKYRFPHAQATDAELRRAHTEAHIEFVSSPPRSDDWLMGDNFFSPATPLACRLAAGCTVQVRPAWFLSPAEANRQGSLCRRPPQALSCGWVVDKVDLWAASNRRWRLSAAGLWSARLPWCGRQGTMQSVPGK